MDVSEHFDWGIHSQNHFLFSNDIHGFFYDEDDVFRPEAESIQVSYLSSHTYVLSLGPLLRSEQMVYEHVHN